MTKLSLKDKTIAVYARGLDLAYGEKIIFAGASFHISAKSKVVLAGPNGSGKTTLIRMILGREQPDRGVLQVAEWVGRIGYMPQAFSDVELPEDISVKEFMLSGKSLGQIAKKMTDINYRLARSDSPELLQELGNLQEKYEREGGYQSEWQIESICTGLGLPAEKIDAQVKSFSGGMKTRLFLARVLFSEPELLILDEPTNHLDHDAILWLGDFLRAFPGTVLIVSHQADFLDEFCDRTLYIDTSQHAIETYTGNYSQAQEMRRQRADNQVKRAAQQAKERTKLQDFVNRWRAGTRARQAQSRLRVLEKMEPIEAVKKNRSLGVKFDLQNRSGAIVAEVKKLSKDFGRGPLFPALSFEIERGDRLAVLGPNGSGKTSLLRILAGRDKDFQGRIKWGHNVVKAYYSQEFESLNPKLTVFEQLQTTFPRLAYQEAMATLGHFLLAKHAEELVSKLSQGERARLSLSQLFLSGANLLILDEPTNHLDQESRAALLAAVKNYRGAIVTVSHDANYLRRIGIDKVIYVPQGRFFHGDLDMIDSAWLER